MFDLFKLSNKKEDMFAGGKVGFVISNVDIVVNSLMKDIKNSGDYSKHFICKIISKKTNLCVNAVWNSFNNKNFILIPILEELIKLWKIKTDKNNTDVKKLRLKILKNVEGLKVNNSSSKKINSLNGLDEEISYFIGAHAADGMISVHLTFFSYDNKILLKFKKDLETFLNIKIKNKVYSEKGKNSFNFGISVDDDTNNKILIFLEKSKQIKSRNIKFKREYRWKLVEGHYLATKRLEKSINKIFGIQLNVKKCRDKNAWELETKNKLLVRYLNIFFNCPYGKKSRIIDEPKIIKRSNLKNRIAFLRGVFTFDGCIDKRGVVKLQTYSPYLFKSIKDILSKNKIKYGVTKPSSGSFVINSKGSDFQNWLFVFEKETEKWKKTKFLGGVENGISIKNEEDFIFNLSRIYPINGCSKISLKKTFKISKKLKICDLKGISKYIMEKFKLKIGEDTLLKNLEILERCNVLTNKKEKVYFLRKKGHAIGTKGVVLKNVFEFNDNVKEWRVPYIIKYPE